MTTMTTSSFVTPKREIMAFPDLCVPPLKRLRHEVTASTFMTPPSGIEGKEDATSPITAAAIPESLMLSDDMFNDAPAVPTARGIKQMDWSNPSANVPALTLRPRRPLLAMRPRRSNIPANFSRMISSSNNTSTTATRKMAKKPSTRMSAATRSLLLNDMKKTKTQNSRTQQQPQLKLSQSQPRMLHQHTRRQMRRLSIKDATRVMESSTYHASQDQENATPLPSFPRRLSLTSLSSHGIADFPELDVSTHSFAGCA